MVFNLVGLQSIKNTHVMLGNSLQYLFRFSQFSREINGKSCTCFNVVLFTYRPWEVDLKNNRNSFGFDFSSLQIFRDFFFQNVGHYQSRKYCLMPQLKMQYICDDRVLKAFQKLHLVVLVVIGLYRKISSNYIQHTRK